MAVRLQIPINKPGLTYSPVAWNRNTHRQDHLVLDVICSHTLQEYRGAEKEWINNFNGCSIVSCERDGKWKVRVVGSRWGKMNGPECKMWYWQVAEGMDNRNNEGVIWSMLTSAVWPWCWGQPCKNEVLRRDTRFLPFVPWLLQPLSKVLN